MNGLKSRLDVIVALTIVVVAAGLFLATVSRAREASDAASCQNKLRQLGMATLHYVDTASHLPPLVDQGDGAPTGRGLPSVFANLMPYIEATPLMFIPGRSPDYYYGHSSVEFKYPHKGYSYTQVGGMANNINSVFLDPADDTARQLRDVPMTFPDNTIGYYATGSYAANGLLPWRTGVVTRALSGGTAQTILFGERPQVCRTAAGDEVFNLWGLGVYSPHMPAFAALTPADPPGLWDTGHALPVEPLPDELADGRDALIRMSVGRHGVELALPSFAAPVQVVRAERPCDPRLPGTTHRRGMMTAMADASMRQFSPDTSPYVFWSACVPVVQHAEP